MRIKINVIALIKTGKISGSPLRSYRNYRRAVCIRFALYNENVEKKRKKAGAGHCFLTRYIKLTVVIDLEDESFQKVRSFI